MRTVVGLAIAGLMAASLVACSPDTSNMSTPGECEVTPSGTVSDGVKVTGDFGSEPTVEFDEPLTVDATQRSVVIEGDGDDVAQVGDEVSVNFSFFNGTTGEAISNSYTDGVPLDITVDETLYIPGLVKTVACSIVGQRIVGVVPPADAFGADGSADLAIQGGQSIVFVVDIVKVSEPTPPAEPEVFEPEEYSTSTGLPAVTLNGDSEPAVTIPDADPTDALRVAVMEEGDGEVVKFSDSVSVLYYGVDWQTGEVFDKSWESPASFPLSGVVSGFAQAIAGRTVGSTLVTVIPPALGYGPSGGSGSIGATDTIVFVIKIVAIVPAG